MIDAFRLINPQLMMLGQEPRQTTSNVGHLNKPSVQVCYKTSGDIFCVYLSDFEFCTELCKVKRNAMNEEVLKGVIIQRFWLSLYGVSVLQYAFDLKGGGKLRISG